MSSRMDKYRNIEEDIPTRSDKNKELYKQIYNAYDSFENLIVPSNAKEITMSDLKKEIGSREEIREKRINKEVNTKDNDSGINKMYQDNSVYDINELINKAVSLKEDNEEDKEKLTNGSYLKKLKLDNRRTNIEQVKEMYEDIKEEDNYEDESLLKTANLSLEILSDLKSDNDGTKVSAPIKVEELPDDEQSFYSDNYKFSKKDFEKNEIDDDDDDEEEDDDEDEEDNDSGNGKFFFKILLLIVGILMIIGLLVYFVIYFNRV